MNWKPGDQAILCNLSPQCMKYTGEIVYIKSTPHEEILLRGSIIIVDIEPIANWFTRVNVVCLKPLPPDKDAYDGWEKTSWDRTIWAPKELVRIPVAEE